MFKRYFFISILLLFNFLWASTCSQAGFEVTAHRVGAGNCIVVRDLETDLSMIVDCGSGGFPSTNLVNPFINEEGEIDVNITGETPEETFSSFLSDDSSRWGSLFLETPSQTTEFYYTPTQRDSPYSNKVLSNRKKRAKPKNPEEAEPELLFSTAGQKQVVRNIRKSLSPTYDFPSDLTVNAVIITHPDRDHLNWIDKVLPNNSRDSVTHIVLGGNPEKYIKKKTFSNWLKNHIDRGSKVYFMALERESPIDSDNIDHANDNNPFIDPIESLKWAKYSPIIDNVDKFPFLSLGDTQLQFLSVNPLHALESVPKEDFRENLQRILEENSESYLEEILLYLEDLENNSVVRINYTEKEGGADDNADSLILKITNRETPELSALLTGDSTALTTRRLLKAFPFDGNDDLYKTTLLLASHHGSDSHGSNNEPWIKATRPEFVFVSHGLLYGHPTQKAYENFQASKTIKNEPITSHYMLTGLPKLKEKPKEFDGGMTERRVLSTLTNGTLVARFEDEIKILAMSYEDSGPIIINPKEEEIAYEDDPSVTVKEDINTSLLVTEDEDEEVVGIYKYPTIQPIPFNLDDNENTTSFVSSEDYFYNLESSNSIGSLSTEISDSLENDIKDAKSFLRYLKDEHGEWADTYIARFVKVPDYSGSKNLSGRARFLSRLRNSKKYFSSIDRSNRFPRFWESFKYEFSYDFEKWKKRRHIQE